MLACALVRYLHELVQPRLRQHSKRSAVIFHNHFTQLLKISSLPQPPTYSRQRFLLPLPATGRPLIPQSLACAPSRRSCSLFLFISLENPFSSRCHFVPGPLDRPAGCRSSPGLSCRRKRPKNTNRSYHNRLIPRTSRRSHTRTYLLTQRLMHSQELRQVGSMRIGPRSWSITREGVR